MANRRTAPRRHTQTFVPSLSFPFKKTKSERAREAIRLFLTHPRIYLGRSSIAVVLSQCQFIQFAFVLASSENVNYFRREAVDDVFCTDEKKNKNSLFSKPTTIQETTYVHEEEEEDEVPFLFFSLEFYFLSVHYHRPLNKQNETLSCPPWMMVEIGLCVRVVVRGRRRFSGGVPGRRLLDDHRR